MPWVLWALNGLDWRFGRPRGPGFCLGPPSAPRGLWRGGEEGEGRGLTYLVVSMGVFQKPGFGVFDCLIGVNLD